MKYLNENKPEQITWESDLKIIDKIKVIVPLKILLVCNSITAKLDGEEFSIVTNIESRTSDTITLSEDYYIPKQKVTAGSIEYLPDEYSHTVVIHRHPDDLNNFSKTDHEFINQNFELSLLYTEKDYFVNGVFNLKYEDAIIPVPVSTAIDYGLEEINIDNIEPIIYSTRVDSLAGRNETKGVHDIDDFLYSYEELVNEINELNSRLEFIENEIQQNRLSEVVN
ncbi:MAG: hypothetical protein IPG78_03950 [Ignavibacteria bacterium]|nr:hypothetical protein [Ignavibacteria bacterium]